MAIYYILCIFYLGQKCTTIYGTDELIGNHRAKVEVGTVLVFSGLYWLVCGTSTEFVETEIVVPVRLHHL